MRQISRRSARRRHTSTRQKGVAERGERVSYPRWAGGLRPKTRGECARGPRPCPWVSCKHHLYLDYYPRYGKIRLNFPQLEVWEMRETCALDVADRGFKQLQAVGDVLGITRERVRQIECAAIEKLRKVLQRELIEELTTKDGSPAFFEVQCSVEGKR